jgi:hypothetical protein
MTTTVQKVAAALRELLAETPDVAMARGWLAEIPADEVADVAAALVAAAGILSYREASARVKAGAS